MNKQEFGGNMSLLRRQVEMLTYSIGMGAEFSAVKYMVLPDHIEGSYEIRLEIRLEYKGYNTVDIFNNTNTFGADDINKVAVALISSFFADYVQNLSLMVNK